MANTYVLIASNTLSSSAASVTFSSIPNTYTDLVLRISARTDNGAVNDGILLTINSTAGTAYSRTNLQGNGATAVSARSSSTNAFGTSPNGAAGSTATASTFGSIELYVPSYTVSQNKPFGYFGAGETNATTAYMGAIAGLWSNTATISQLDLTPNSGVNFVSGSSFFLYGIKNS